MDELTHVLLQFGFGLYLFLAFILLEAHATSQDGNASCTVLELSALREKLPKDLHMANSLRTVAWQDWLNCRSH